MTVFSEFFENQVNSINSRNPVLLLILIILAANESLSKDRMTSGYMVLIFRAIHVLQWHLQCFDNPNFKGTLIVKKVSQFGLKTVIVFMK